MSLRHLLPLFIIGGGFSVVGTVLYGAWLLGRYRGREDEAPVELANVEMRLYRLEQSMAAMTSSLDRLEAAHRLTARMLTDQPTDPVRLPRRVVTPH
ncbi:MAG TPA: hypothetical protein VIP11_05105 [Gemmatimonadaceae bacterium]